MSDEPVISDVDDPTPTTGTFTESPPIETIELKDVRANSSASDNPEDAPDYDPMVYQIVNGARRPDLPLVRRSSLSK